MKNVIYAINLSADGCCDHTKFSPGDNLMEYWNDLMNEVDTIVWGRKTYELMVPYWPEVAKEQSGTKAENVFATRLTELPKVVFSRTLEHAEGNTRIIRDDLAGEVLKLKQASGDKKISIGGVSIPEQLIALGLVDEIRFLVHPVIAGEGRRILSDTVLNKNLDMQLVETKTFESGAVALHYSKRSS
jgi:dihydrofolate reductase